MIKLSNLSKIYIRKNVETTALNNISLEFDDKGFVSIVGPSGCGKTTLLNIIGGLDKHTSGDLIIDNINTKTFKEKDYDYYRNHSVGFVFQNYNLISTLTVYENVELSLNISSVKDRKDKVLNALNKVGLLKHQNKKPGELSGGESQRVAIARAIVNDPEVILADEPTGALDSKTATNIMQLLKEISMEKLVVVVTHNESLSSSFSTRIIRLLDGEIIEDINKEIVNEDNKNKKRIKSSLMNYNTTLKISFKNILVRKFRTLLVILSVSIGIVGVSLVLTVSNGMSFFIKDIEKQLVISSPLYVTSYTDQGESGIVPVEYEEFPDSSVVNVIKDIPTYYNKYDYFTSDFLDYIENIDSTLYKGIYYNSCSVDTNIITKCGTNYKEVNSTYYIREIFEKDELFGYYYDCLYNELPNEIDEVALLIDSKNGISESTLKTLGIDYENKTSFTFEELIGKEYKVIKNNDLYYKHGDVYNTKNDLAFLYDNASLTLKITAIVRVSSDVSSGLYYNTSGLLYTKAFRDYIYNDNLNSNIVKDQLLYGTEKNVFTNLPFTDYEGSYIQTKEYRLESQLCNLGARVRVNGLYIYTNQFEDRVKIGELLEQYKNNNTDQYHSIRYSDRMTAMTNDFDNFLHTLTMVFVVFMCVSLFISAIMIAIITYVSVIERTKEIGLLRSLGAKKIDILNIFNTEGGIVGLSSGIIGVLGGVLLTKPILGLVIKIMEDNNLNAYDLSRIKIAQFDIQQLILLVIGSTILTIVAGLIPAIIAANKNPVEALKHE